MQKYKKQCVSVIMPTYKRSEKIERAIESVLKQTYKNIELLVVNDNDPDDEFSEILRKKIKKYENDKRFRFINQKYHINGAVARNVGIKKALGEYIAFLDDDDWWKPEKIEHQIRELESRTSEWGGVSCRIEQYDNNKIIAKLPKYKSGFAYKDILMLKSDFATGTLMLRHSALDKIGYFDETLLRHQDLQLLIMFTYTYKIYQLDEFLHCCDVSDTQNRANAEKLIEHKKKFFHSVKNIIKSLSKREKRCVYCIHNFEIAYVYFMEKNYKKAFQYGITIFVSPKATILTLNKIIKKIKSRIERE